MKNWLEKQFRLSEFHTDVKTEILAGLTTFVTMAYILATVPNIMSGAGFDKHVTLTIMILLIIVTTCAMALYTNRLLQALFSGVVYFLLSFLFWDCGKPLCV